MHPAEEAIYDHNRAMQTACGRGDQEGVRCKYRPYFPRRCTDCPTYDRIEYPAGSGLYPEGPPDSAPDKLSAEEHCKLLCAWKGGGPCGAADCPRRAAGSADVATIRSVTCRTT